MHTLRQVSGGEAQFILITYWQSELSIRAFAGDDVTRARYYAEDDDFLLDRPEGVDHYRILHAQRPNRVPRSGVARVWRARAPQAEGSRIARILGSAAYGVLPDPTAGFHGAELLRRTREAEEDFLGIHWFDSARAAAAYAAREKRREPLRGAAPPDDTWLAEPVWTHYEVCPTS